MCKACRLDIHYTTEHIQHRCPKCQVALLSSTQCQDCHEHKLILRHIDIGFDYHQPVDSLVLRFKNAHQQNLSHPLADLVYERLQSEQRLPSDQAPLIPIPSSQAAIKRRGYNPAAEFAKSLAKRLNSPLDLTILRRHPSQGQNKSLSRQARLAANAQLYYCAYRLDCSRAILMDDVMTSGSTLNSAARALLAAGVQTVDAIVIARATHHQ